MRESDTVVVLCGGSLNTMNLPFGTNVSNAMVPVNGKPVIGWILDDLIQKGQRSVTVVLRKENERLRLFLARAYGKRLHVTAVLLEHEGSIVESLEAGLDASVTDGAVGVLLGDTLIPDPFEGNADFIYVGEVEDTSRWCIVRTDARGIIVDYADKQQGNGSRHLAAAGYYYLRDGRYLKDCVKECLIGRSHELSDVLKRYADRHPILARHAQQWHDFGHVDNFARAKRTLLPSRFFNSLSVNPVLNTITKVSTDNQKLEDELAWYLTIPEELKVLTPRIVSQRRVNGCLEIVQEYYGYPTLAELFVYSDLPVDAWRTILRRVLGIHAEFRRYRGEVTEADVVEMYVGKTTRRLDDLAGADSWWATHLKSRTVRFNGQALRNVRDILPDVEREVQKLARAPLPSVVHGDLCFSNILFDFSNQIIRLIDPRGRFGHAGIYGDARYDVAKLRHSVHGLYDFMIADMFQIDVDDTGATGGVLSDGVATSVGEVFDGMVCTAGYDLREIQLIEGLLFLSMLPLHQGHRRRQQMMYYTGISLLNEVL